MRKFVSAISMAVFLAMGCTAVWAKNGITAGTIGGLQAVGPISHQTNEVLVLFFRVSSPPPFDGISKHKSASVDVELTFSDADGAVLKSVTLPVPFAGFRRVTLSALPVNSSDAELFVDLPGGLSELVGVVPLDERGLERVAYLVKADLAESSSEKRPVTVQMYGALANGSTGETKAIWLPAVQRDRDGTDTTLDK